MQRRAELLAQAGFEFDEGEAEWQRWYGQLRAFFLQQGSSSIDSLAVRSDEFRLINW